MKKILFAVAITSLAVTTANAAAPPSDLLAGSEIRRNVEFGGIQRYEVLRLAPDGSFTGVYETTRPVARGSEERRTGAVRGRWSLEGGALCFEGSGLEYAGRNCYRLSHGGYSKRQWSGVNVRTGDIWQFFIYPRGS
ncbi:MAG TPA: hypothetical protein VM325_20545 [Alphaproteobacteria bacterium]|nr:hypothetical protein [Alphaproteobacteria bacterium]